MGNCQAIDNASLVIQHPKGKVDKLFSTVSAEQIMKMNPGHYVALLLTTTTLYSNTGAASTSTAGKVMNNNKTPLRVTRIKLLRPTDTLVLGHVYRLVTTQEMMKGLVAKKQAKMNQQQQGYGNITEKEISDIETVVKNTQVENRKQIGHERHRSRNNSGAASKSRGAWQPSLRSISESAS